MNYAYAQLQGGGLEDRSPPEPFRENLLNFVNYITKSFSGFFSSFRSQIETSGYYDTLTHGMFFRRER